MAENVRSFFRKSGPLPFAAAWVEVKNDIAFVCAQSGGRGVVADHDAFSTHLTFPPAGMELGSAVRSALAASRRLDPKKIGAVAVETFMFEEAQQRHRLFLSDALRLTGAKSESAYLRGIKACSLLRLDDRVQVVPTLDGHGSWGDHQATEDHKRYFSVSASDEEIQSVVLEALSISK